MTREEHLRWCKGRALAYLPGRPQEAVTSMLSDLGKRPETRAAANGPVGLLGLAEAVGADPESVRRFVEGFN